MKLNNVKLLKYMYVQSQKEVREKTVQKSLFNIWRNTGPNFSMFDQNKKFKELRSLVNPKQN